MKAVHVEYWVQTKEWWNTELKGIVPSMIQSVVACSMQFGFNSVGVSCSVMSEVSSRGGK